MNKEDLNIYPVKPLPDSNAAQLDPRLPDINKGCIICHVGSIKSGKSTVLSNYLLRKELFWVCFPCIFCYCVHTRFLTYMTVDVSFKFGQSVCNLSCIGRVLCRIDISHKPACPPSFI